MASKDRRVSFGPGPVSSYPYSAWSRLPRGVSESLWQLVGPTVQRNIDQPLWAQFCAVYFEGLNHGAGAARELDARPPVEPRDAYRELMVSREDAGA